MSVIPAGVQRRMILRSFAVQGSWNYETLIGAGFTYTLLPALRFLHGSNGAALDAAVARHAELFNSHPYVATLAVGAVSRLEADGVDPAVVERFKLALRGSLGSIGDRLVWSAWRPMSVLLGLGLLLAGAAWWIAVGVFLAVYNVLHLTLRITGMRVGVRSGLEVGRILREAPLQPTIDRAGQVASTMLGFGVVLLAAPNGGAPAAAGATLLAVVAGAWLGFRSRRVTIAVLAAVAVVAIVLGSFGYGA